MPSKQANRTSILLEHNTLPNYPDFLDIQIKSFQDFFQLETKSDERNEEGLFNTFKENFPITDTRNQFVLEFLDYFVDPPRYSIQECIEARIDLFCPTQSTFEIVLYDSGTRRL